MTQWWRMYLTPCCVTRLKWVKNYWYRVLVGDYYTFFTIFEFQHGASFDHGSGKKDSLISLDKKWCIYFKTQLLLTTQLNCRRIRDISSQYSFLHMLELYRFLSPLFWSWTTKTTLANNRCPKFFDCRITNDYLVAGIVGIRGTLNGIIY